MKLYNEFYKSAEMPFSENSKFYVDNSNVFVTFSVRTSANFSEQYQTELIQGILGMFDFKDFSTTNMVTFLVSEALDRIVTQENRNLFVYLITKCMCIKQFCGTMEAKIKLTEKDLHYKKVKLAKLLSAFPKDFICAYVSYIYSAIIDAVEKVLEIAETDAKYYPFAYKLTKIALEYTDDVVAVSEGRENVGYPRFNKTLLKNRPLLSSKRSIERAKKK